MKYNIRHTILILPLLTFTLSCGTYNQSIDKFYKGIKEERYEEANNILDKNKLLKASRNKLLFLLEKGKVLFLLGKYDESNNALNEADNLIEAQNKTLGDIAISTAVNPMVDRYHAADFEKFMIHYYKALNYLFLNNIEDAVVEARRISIQTNALGDEKANKTNKYSKDAFSLIIQGLIYEASNDINNAFISYRNAVDTYLEQKNHYWYGVKLPEQLVTDVLDLSLENGFYSDYEYIAKKLDRPITNKISRSKSKGGDLIIFFENGLGPVKDQQEFFFTLVRGVGGNFYFKDDSGALNIPVIIPLSANDNINLNDIQTFRLAFPKWVEQEPPIKRASVKLNNHNYQFEKIEDINVLASELFKEKFLSEATEALSRLLVKKLAEYGVKSIGKKENNDIFMAAAAAIQLYSLISEKADTRNWQTLPAEISYVRIPLNLGENKITVSLTNNNGLIEDRELNINSINSKLKFYSFSIFH